MNNNIQESYCSFEVSQLLKDKGFDVECRFFYDTEFQEMDWHIEYENFRNSEIVNGHGYGGGKGLRFPMISAPTHSVAIEWIKVNFGIHINPILKIFPNYYRTTVSMHGKHPEELDANTDNCCWSSPKEAIEAALLYTLKDLIK